jgi:hypothetical protein
MTITINIHAHCPDHEAVLALLEQLPINTTTFNYQVLSDAPDDEAMDLTPPHGIERPEPISERDQAMNKAVQHYIAALIIWTRQHITVGPVHEVSDAQLRGAYDDIMSYGLDTDIEDSCDLTLEQASCVRGAFRDATAGMVPI